MARVRLMYWKEIPVQAQSIEGGEQTSLPLDERFQHGADAISMFDGSAGTDDYLMGWNWGEYFDVEGSSKEAARRVADDFNRNFPADFVARIRDLHNAGKRDPRPGAIDHWARQGSDESTTRSGLLDRLSNGETLVSDGATGTYLQAKGLEPGGCPEAMNADQPDLIRKMAAEYFEAGSDLALTVSFGGARHMLSKYGHAGRVAELNALAARHARAMAPPGRFVLGSVGPTGEILRSNGGVTEESEVFDAFAEQIAALHEGGADGVVIETMISVEEALLAARAARELSNLTVMTTMMFDKGPRGWFTMMGDTPESAAKRLRDAGVDVVGANCGNGSDRMLELARIIRDADDGFMLVHCNAGIPEIRKGQIIYPETPEYMTRRFIEMARAGVNIIGGCCGTTPQHISHLSRAIHAWEGGGDAPAGGALDSTLSTATGGVS